MIANPAVMSENVSVSLPLRRVRMPVIIEAAPPKPFSKPTSWGIWIIFTFCPTMMPSTPLRPGSLPKAGKHQGSGDTKVSGQWRLILLQPPIRLPLTAVFTFESIEIPSSKARVRTTEITVKMIKDVSCPDDCKELRSSCMAIYPYLYGT